MAGSNGDRDGSDNRIQISTAQVPLHARTGFPPVSHGVAAGDGASRERFEIVTDPGGTRVPGEATQNKLRPGFWKRNRRWFLVAVIAALILWAFVKYGIPRMERALNTVSTDDAFVSGHITYVSPRVEGLVVEVLVDQYDQVAAGDLLVRLDREPYEVAVAQSEAAVEQARAQLAGAVAQAQAQLAGARANWFRRKSSQERLRQQVAALRSDVANLDSSRATLELAQANLRRGEQLLPGGGISQEELDQRNITLKQAQEQVKAAWAQVQERRASLGLLPNTTNPLDVPKNLEQEQSTIQEAVSEIANSLAQLGIPFDVHKISAQEAYEDIIHLDSSQGLKSGLGKLLGQVPSVQAAQAGLTRALRQLENDRLRRSYTEIRAEVGGHIQDRSVHPGNRVEPGQTLLSLRPDHVWITANFKETQVRSLLIGQPVDIHVDAYPRRTFRGRVSGFSPGTGLSESLLPPENATGNYVKVTQRLPVRIELDEPYPTDTPLFVGLSVVPEVRCKEKPTGPGAGQRVHTPEMTLAPDVGGGPAGVLPINRMESSRGERP
jgi:membrane fusion protein, multidrug efflux system